MFNLVVASLTALLLTAMGGYLVFRLYRYKVRAHDLQQRLNVLVGKDPLQLDLELATTDQLLAELRKRPQPQFVLLLPRFELMGIDLQMEVHNLPPHIALGLLRLGHKLAARQGGQEVVEQSEDFFTELPPDQG
jgi:hypothetical protein